MSSRPELKLDGCSYQAAKYAVEHWHYSKAMPVGKLAKIGVWENGQFIGVVIFGLGSAAACDGRKYGLRRNFDMVELQRVALQEHRSPVTRIISIAIRLLKALAPGVRLLISYADPAHTHVGAIYQAGNWIYTGCSADDWLVILPDGRSIHSRIARAHVQFGIRKLVDISGGRKIKTPGKHRYLYPLDDEMRDRILPLALPYPKRAVSIESDAPADQAGMRAVQIRPRRSNLESANA